jgi:hypothetical protein
VKGRHDVRLIRIDPELTDIGLNLSLEPGWKPFGTIGDPPGPIYLVCRKWERLEDA